MNQGDLEKIKPMGGTILEKIVVTEGAAEILAKAEHAVYKAKLNEAVRIIEQLEKEVSEMVIPARFKKEKIPTDSPFSAPDKVFSIQGLNEKEYKRAQLLRDLTLLKNKIVLDIQGLRSVVTDIEATKIDRETDAVEPKLPEVPIFNRRPEKP